MVFLPTGVLDFQGEARERYIRERLRWRGDIEAMDREDVKRWVAWGLEVGSHSVTHRPFSELDPGTAWRELTESKDMLEQLIGRSVRFFAWPFGRRRFYPPEYVDLAIEAGYEAVFRRSPEAGPVAAPEGFPPPGSGSQLGSTSLSVLELGRVIVRGGTGMLSRVRCGTWV